MENVLAIDIGTSSIKIAQISSTGKIIWMDIGRLSRQQACKADEIERRWIDMIIDLFKKRPRQISPSALVVSGQGPTMVAIDQDMKIVSSPLLWTDRSEQRIDGQRSYFLPKVSYFRRQYPKLFKRVAVIMPVSEYISTIFGASPATVLPSSAYCPYYWDDESLKVYRLPAALFAPHVVIGRQIGSVSKIAALRFGISANIPIYGAGLDYAMSLIGTDTLIPGRICDCAGTSEGINYCSSRQLTGAGIRCQPHLLDHCYNISATVDMSGFHLLEALDPFRQKFLALDNIIIRGEHRKSLSYYDNKSLPIKKSKLDQVWIKLCEIANKFGESVDNLRRAGCQIDSIRMCGGQASSSNWNRMKANAGRVSVIEMEHVHAELIGGAACGFVGLGRYSTIDEAASAMVRPFRRINPND